jgi:hypothetical protein
MIKEVSINVGPVLNGYGAVDVFKPTPVNHMSHFREVCYILCDSQQPLILPLKFGLHKHISGLSLMFRVHCSQPVVRLPCS